jgi:hypothetical protein
MKKQLLVTVLLVVMPCMIITLWAWGFWGHQRINRMAVFTLPEGMIGFYKKHIDFITEHAVDPDKRRYSDPEEAPRHYIDIDRYGEHPFDSLPQNWKDAVAKYGEDSLKTHGIVAWHIPVMLFRLTKAFREHDEEKILRISAELGHYVGDAHVPLHCTRNYNGQLTNQNGIHGFWESRLPELYGEGYDYFTGRCRYIQKPGAFAWKIIRESYAAHDSVLNIERELNASFPVDRKYAYEEKGNTIVRVYSREYSLEYQRLLNGMVERRMRDAILAVSSLWYTAWVNAGMPHLGNLTEFVMSDSLKNEIDQVNKFYELKKGSVKGHED